MFGVFVKTNRMNVLLVAYETKLEADAFVKMYNDLSDNQDPDLVDRTISDGKWNKEKKEWIKTNFKKRDQYKEALKFLFPDFCYFGCGAPSSPFVKEFVLGERIVTGFDLD